MEGGVWRTAYHHTPYYIRIVRWNRYYYIYTATILIDSNKGRHY